MSLGVWMIRFGLSPTQMVDRSMAMTKHPVGSTRDGIMHKPLGFGHGLWDRQPIGEICGDRCGQGAPCAVIISC